MAIKRVNATVKKTDAKITVDVALALRVFIKNPSDLDRLDDMINRWNMKSYSEKVNCSIIRIGVKYGENGFIEEVDIAVLNDNIPQNNMDIEHVYTSIDIDLYSYRLTYKWISVDESYKNSINYYIENTAKWINLEKSVIKNDEFFDMICKKVLELNDTTGIQSIRIFTNGPVYVTSDAIYKKIEENNEPEFIDIQIVIYDISDSCRIDCLMVEYADIIIGSKDYTERSSGLFFRNINITIKNDDNGKKFKSMCEEFTVVTVK